MRVPQLVQLLFPLLGGEDKARCRRRCAEMTGRPQGRYVDPNLNRPMAACVTCPKRGHRWVTALTAAVDEAALRVRPDDQT